MTYPTGSAPSGAYVVGTVSDAQGQSEASIRNHINSQATGGFGMAQDLLWGNFLGTILEALTGFLTVREAKQFSDAQQALMADHTKQITELREAFGQIILQGNSIVFTSNNTYYPTTGITSIDIVVIGAGGGGSSGIYDHFNAGAQSGGGGGGGGEVHTSIPSSLLPRNPDGSFQGIPIVVGAGGAGGQGGDVGAGGGNSALGVSGQQISGGGGNGAAFGGNAVAAPGGIGMIPGGIGGRGGYMVIDPINGGDPVEPRAAGSSVSAYTLNGGGGGGGYGGSQASTNKTAGAGGAGGISPGGQGGNISNIGQPGQSPSSLVATGGGGGGGGGYNGNRSGGAGAFPAGGGGGGGCGNSGTGGRGGNGGNGILFVIERFN